MARLPTVYWRDLSSGVSSSDIIATVLIIAVTLIASVAIGGFVFGIFAQGQNSAQIAVTGTALLAINFLSKIGRASCRERINFSVYDLTLNKKGIGISSVAAVPL